MRTCTRPGLKCEVVGAVGNRVEPHSLHLPWLALRLACCGLFILGFFLFILNTAYMKCIKALKTHRTSFKVHKLLQVA